MFESDLVLGGVPRFAPEAPWAARLQDRYARAIPFRRKTDARGRRPVVADAAGDAPFVLVQADPEAYLLPEAAERLLAAAESGPAGVVLPVSNEPWCEETRAVPPFAYSTPSLLEEAVRAMASSSEPPRPAISPKSAIFAARREVLSGLPGDSPLDELPRLASERGE